MYHIIVNPTGGKGKSLKALGKVEEFEQLRNFKNEEKLKLKNFNFCWWHDPPYKNDDFRRRVQLS